MTSSSEPSPRHQTQLTRPAPTRIALPRIASQPLDPGDCVHAFICLGGAILRLYIIKALKYSLRVYVCARRLEHDVRGRRHPGSWFPPLCDSDSENGTSTPAIERLGFGSMFEMSFMN